eukprot:g9021.t1
MNLGPVKNAILFLTYEATSRFLRDPSKKEDSLQTVFLAGCVAGSGSALINGPTEHIAKTLVQEHGVLHPRGPLRGLGTTIIRDTPSVGLYFVVYELLTRQLGKGASAWACVYPIDVIKTRWTTAQAGVYSSVLQCFRTTTKQGGWGALLSGFLDFQRSFAAFMACGRVLQWIKAGDEALCWLPSPEVVWIAQNFLHGLLVGSPYLKGNSVVRSSVVPDATTSSAVARTHTATQHERSSLT